MSTISTLPERRRVGHTANVPAAYGPRPPRRRRPPPTQRRPRSEEESEGGASSSSPTHGLFNRARDFAIEGGTFNAVEAGGVVFMNYHPQTRRQIRRLVRERRHDPHQPAASPSTRAPPKSESKIYHDQLITKCRGTPLWIPGPNKRLPRAYRREGTNIGDVGMVTDLGSFRFLFNIFEEATSDINGGMVPDGFVPLRLTASEGARLASRAVEEFKLYTDKSWIGEGVDEEVTSSAGGFTFTTHASEGAILMMPHGATSKDFTMQNLLKHYVATHLENWYQYVNHRCHHDAKNGELRLVSGCDKTSSWGIATFRHQESTLALQGAKRMHFKPDRQGDGKTYVWSCLTGGSGRVGPAESELMDLVDIGDSTATETNNEGQHRRGGQIENQCLFIRTINAMCGAAQKRRIWGDVAMVAADDPEVTHQHLGNSARPGNQSMSQDGQLSAGSSVWGADSQSIWQTGIQFTHMDGQPTPNIHPSDLLNNALLEMHPEANIVVSEDADWMDTTCWCRTTLTQANLLHFKEVEVKDGVLSLERFSPKVLQNMPKMRFIRTGIPHPLYNSVRTNLRVVVGRTLFRLRRQNLSLSLKGLAAKSTRKHIRKNTIIKHLHGDEFANILAKHYTDRFSEPRSRRGLYVSAQGSGYPLASEETLDGSDTHYQDTVWLQLNSESTVLPQRPRQAIVKLQPLIIGAVPTSQMKPHEEVWTPFKPQKSDLTFLILGTTGVGKSTFVNAIAGYEASQTSDELGLCTRKVVPIACQPCEGRGVVMVDTPGFDNTDLSDMDAFRLVAAWLKQTYEDGIKLSGVLLLHRITDNRLNGGAHRLLNVFKDICGPDALKNSLLVTTMWDQIEEAQGSEREQELAEAFWSPMIARGARVKRFLNTPESALDIVSLLANDALQYPLLLQVELVDEGKDLARTTAGRSILSWLNDRLDVIRKQTEAITTKIRQATKKGNIVQKLYLQRQMKTMKAAETNLDQILKSYSLEPIQICDEPSFFAELPQSLMSISPSSSISSPSLASLSPDGSESGQSSVGIQTPPEDWNFSTPSNWNLPIVADIFSKFSRVSLSGHKNPEFSSRTALSNHDLAMSIDSKDLHSIEDCHRR